MRFDFSEINWATVVVAVLVVLVLLWILRR